MLRRSNKCKKTFMPAFLLFGLCVLLLSCQTVKKIGPYSDTSENASISVEGIVQKSSPYLWAILIPITYRSNQGLSVLIENIGDTPIMIDWNKSSISYGNNTSNVFLSGQKFISAGSTTNIPLLSMPGGARKVVDIYPSESIKWSGDEWKIKSMKIPKDAPITLSIYFTMENLEYISVIEVPNENYDGFKFGL